MCAEGIALGRTWQPTVRRINLIPTGLTEIVGAAGNRVRLILAAAFDAAVGGGEFLWIGPPQTGTVIPALVISPEQPTAILRIEDWGPLLLGPWVVYPGTLAGVPFGITDIRTTGFIPPYDPER